MVFREGVSPEVEVARLEQVYGFSPEHVYTVIPGFAAGFDADVREMLRCEPSVAYVEHDAIVHID